MSKQIKFSILFLIIILTLFGFYKLYEVHFRSYIMVKFSETGPLYANMPVYYKGCKIGFVKRIDLSKDYKYTFMKIVFFEEPNLSETVVARVKKFDLRKKYIDLVNLDSTSTTKLKMKSTIDGEPAFDLEAFLSEIADSDLIVPLIETFTDTLSSLKETSNEIKSLASDSRSVIKDNRNNLRQTTKSLSNGTKSLGELSSRLNNSLTDSKLENTMLNVDKSSDNIHASTKSLKNTMSNIENATKNIDKTVCKLDSMLCEATATVKNTTKITGSFCEVLSKRFAGIRIIFGKPMSKNKCKCGCP